MNANHVRERRCSRWHAVIVVVAVALGLQPSCGPITGEAEGGKTTQPMPVTYYTNPGDARIASVVVEGRPTTYFGPKSGDGGVERISHMVVDSVDRDPAKRMLYEFAPNGDPTKAALATGETMLLSWTSSTTAAITLRSADGQSENRVVYDFAAAPSTEPKAIASRSTRLGAEPRALERAAVGERSHPERTGRVASADEGGRWSPGVIDVKCADGSPVSDATVTGVVVVPTNVVDEKNDVTFTESRPGHFDYSLPIAPAPPTDVSAFRAGLKKALAVLCAGNLARFVGVTNHSVCLAMLGAPAVGTAMFGVCTTMLATYGLVCLTNFVFSVGGVTAEATRDLWATQYKVTATAHHGRLPDRDVKLTAYAGQPIPPGVIQYAEAGVISSITTEPVTPQVKKDYVIKVQTACAGAGYTLMLSMTGSDGHEQALPAPVALSATVHEATLTVLGAKEKGVADRIVAVLRGPSSDTRQTTIVFR
ncbi:MAG TPA: hypothetical protein VM925_27810 [Labilithrix sp.]|nr:hypothetical protein [Labilithrix sp.]